MHPAGLARAFDITDEDMIVQAGKDWADAIYRLMELLEDEASEAPETPTGEYTRS